MRDIIINNSFPGNHISVLLMLYISVLLRLHIIVLHILIHCSA